MYILYLIYESICHCSFGLNRKEKQLLQRIKDDLIELSEEELLYLKTLLDKPKKNNYHVVNLLVIISHCAKMDDRVLLFYISSVRLILLFLGLYMYPCSKRLVFLYPFYLFFL